MRGEYKKMQNMHEDEPATNTSFDAKEDYQRYDRQA